MEGRFYIDESDGDLVKLLVNGDRKAFKDIYSRYSSELYRFARRNINSKEDCEEIIQDVFLSLWARHKALEVQSLRHYLFNAVRYKVIRYFQHSAVKAKFETHYRNFESEVEKEDVKKLDPDKIREMILEHLQPLPERCQEAFRLRLVENLSNSEIAERMHIAKKTVEIYMFKAFNHLRSNAKDLINSDQSMG